MKKNRAFFFYLILGASTAYGDLPPALTFKDCFDLAVKQSERLLQSQENIEQSKAHRQQAIGSILPNLRWSLATTLQDTSGLNSDDDNENNNNSLRRTRTESKFVARQPIFQGFKEYYAIKSIKAEQRKNEALLMRETVNLYMDVAQVFYRVLQLEQFQADTRALISLTDDRIKELRGRINLGKSRDSELLTVESQMAILRSQEAANAGNIISIRDVLGFILGIDARSIALIDSVVAPSMVDPEEKILKFGVSRSDVRAFQEDAEAKRYAIRVAKAGFYPSAAVIGDYYTQRTGTQSEIDWDIIFNLDVPIFQGGTVKAFADEARSRYRQADLELQRGIRFAESEIRQARAKLASSIGEAALLEVAYEKSKRSFESFAKEYRLGLTNNLDVLQSMNAMQQVKISYDTALLQTKLDTLILKAVTEELP